MDGIRKSGGWLGLTSNACLKGFVSGTQAVAGGVMAAVVSLAAILVVAEVGLLFYGVVERYVLEDPVVWSDELASILFLWLGMLGAVVAFHRREHMAMTALLDAVSEQRKLALEILRMLVCAIFLLLMIKPAWIYAHGQVLIQSPALGISDFWRAAALPVGIGLMFVLVLLQMLQVMHLRRFWVLAGIVVAVVAGMSALTHIFVLLGNLNLLIFFVGATGATVMLGVPIAFAFGIATCAYLALSTDMPLAVVVGRIDGGMSNFVLLAVPLFVLLGTLIEANGMARSIVRFLMSLIGHVRGGLSYVLLGAIYLVSGIAGSKAADMAAVAPALFPEMQARGSKPGELVALLSSAGAMSETIPPSLVLITLGTVTGVSISALFTGGLLPGVVLALMLAVVARFRSAGQAVSTRSGLRAICISLVAAAPALVLPFIIRAAVILGATTPTEVSTLGIVYALILGPLFYRRISWREFGPLLAGAATLSGAILLIIGTATAMAWALTQSGFSLQLAAAMASLPGGSWGFMAVSILAFVLLGSVLEGIPAVVLFGPLLFPIAQRMGINEVHYAIVVVLAMGIGLFTPPFGVGYYTACAISRVPSQEGMRPIIGYIATLLIGLIIVAAVPWISIGFL